jgi:hypothetical protein
MSRKLNLDEIGQELFREKNTTFSEIQFLVQLENCRSVTMLWNDYIWKCKNLSESVWSTLFRTKKHVNRINSVLQYP